MTQTSMMPGQASTRRIRLRHHVVELDDGHEVGVSVGGQGVPLVFLHGLVLSRRAYLRMLSRVAGLGFQVVAIDAAGHGDTHNLPRDARGFDHRVDLTVRALDALGVSQAVIAGHSMGGRMAIQLAARAPERAMAVVLLDAAAGARFDAAIPTVLRSPRAAARIVLGAAYDTQQDPFRLGIAEQGRYLRMLASVAMHNARRPSGVAGAARAIVQSGDYSPLLRMMRDHAVPTFVLHGEKDLIVPFDSARDIADDANATLYCVPDAYHSWMITNPRQGADAFRQLVHGELGEVLRNTANALGIMDFTDATCWEDALIAPDALVRELNEGTIEELGAEEPEPVELQPIRRAWRPRWTQRMRWVERTYRRRAAGSQARIQPPARAV
jgi:pimeloyl-ACP methyl ester carboxylesterase